MSTKHSKAAARFIGNRKQEAWHDETLWMVRVKRDKMSHSLPEWERLRELACEIKLYSNSHLMSFGRVREERHGQRSDCPLGERRGGT